MEAGLRTGPGLLQSPRLRVVAAEGDLDYPQGLGLCVLPRIGFP